jgi:hypothetical protein
MYSALMVKNLIVKYRLNNVNALRRTGNVT